MVQATSARNTDRDRLKSRPSVAARGASPETAPVLFRLPVIVPPSANGGDAKPAAQPVAEVTAPPSPINPPPVSASSVHVPFPTAGASMAVTPAAQSTAAEHHATTNSRIETQLDTLTGADAAAVSYPNVQPARTAAAVETSGAEAPHPATSTSAGQPAEITAPAVHRSWWEHWSSGVVLILLIIALVTASILALNDGGKPNKEQLVSDSVTAAMDDFDLSNITIPDIAVRKVEPVEEISQVVEREGAASPLAKTETAVAGIDTAQPAKNTDLASEAPEAPAAAAKSSESGGAMAALAPPANANLVSLPSKPSTQATGDNSANAASPLASLTLPVGVSPAPLFDARSSIAADSGAPAMGGTPAATTGVVQLPNQNVTTTTAENTTPPPVSGASPQLYDGAGVGPELHATKQVAADAPNRGAVPVETNLPSYATILASATQTVTPGPGPAAARDPGATAPAVSPAAANTSQQQQYLDVVQTATPELDTQAIINAYLPYSQTNKASNGAATNRFVPANASPATGQLPASPPASQPASRGFTLGN